MYLIKQYFVSSRSRSSMVMVLKLLTKNLYLPMNSPSNQIVDQHLSQMPLVSLISTLASIKN